MPNKELKYLIQRIKENKYLTRDETNYIIKALEQESTTKNDLAVDCIDRQATLDAIIKRLGIKNETYLLEAERYIYQQILAMPSVTPQEPKTGHWVDRWNKIFLCENKDCSICGYMAQTRYNYCPNCGAKMIEPQESEGEK